MALELEAQRRLTAPDGCIRSATFNLVAPCKKKQCIYRGRFSPPFAPLSRGTSYTLSVQYNLFFKLHFMPYHFHTDKLLRVDEGRSAYSEQSAQFMWDSGRGRDSRCKLAHNRQKRHHGCTGIPLLVG